MTNLFFNQAYVSPVLREYFEKNFMEKWNFNRYVDIFKPCVFFGLYTQKDMELLYKHKSYSLILWGGNDFQDKNILEVSKKEKTIQIGYGWKIKKYKQLNIPFEKLIIPIKDYSYFHPSPLGDKIYVYKGIHGDRQEYFNWDSTIVPLIKLYGEDKFIYTSRTSLQDLKKNYYDKSFLYIKPNDRGGSTGMWELGCMGRKTVANNQGDLPNVLSYGNIDDIKKLIDIESKKIGTTQIELSKKVHDCFTNNNNWLNLNYYEKYFSGRD